MPDTFILWMTGRCTSTNEITKQVNDIYSELNDQPKVHSVAGQMSLPDCYLCLQFFSCAFHLYMVSRYRVLQLTDNDIFMKMYTTTFNYYLSTFQHIEQHDGTCIKHLFCCIKITLLSNCIFFQTA